MENSLANFGGHAYSGVADAEKQLQGGMRGIRFRAMDSDAALTGEFDRVSDKIYQDLPELGAVSRDNRRTVVRDVDLKGDPAGFSFNPERQQSGIQ